MDQYFIRRGKEVSGPFTLAEVMAKYQSQQLTPLDTIAGSQTGPWESVADFCLQQASDDQTDARLNAEPGIVSAALVEPNPFAASSSPPSVAADPASPTEADSTGGLIPYKNPHALTAYYLGIFSGLPLIGLPFGIAAFILGLKGLKARQQNPVIKGSVHAAIGIGCGGLFSLVWGGVLIVILLQFL